MRLNDDFIAVSRHDTSDVQVNNSEIVFVGYGVVAPEFGWDDYKDVDVRGKTVLIMVGDPPIPSAADSAALDTAMFRGKAMTYYGRWTYKYEKRREKGAAAAIIIHQTGPAGYPWEVVSGSWGQENFDIASSGANIASRSRAGSPRRRLASSSSTRVATLMASRVTPPRKRSNHSRSSAPRAGASGTRSAASSRGTSSPKLEGSDPTLKDEYIVYTAHWDHFGVNRSLTGRPDPERRGRQRVRHGADDRDRQGVHEARGKTEALHALPRRHRRGSQDSSARSTTRRIRCIRSTRRWPTSTSTEPTSTDGRPMWS